MKALLVSISIVVIAVMFPCCAEMQAASSVWRASLVDADAPWTADDTLEASFSVAGNGTKYSFHPIKRVDGPTSMDLRGNISTELNPEPFFLYVGGSQGNPQNSDNLHLPLLHDQAIYLYIVGK